MTSPTQTPPTNKLNNVQNYVYKHVLVAYTTTSDALSTTVNYHTAMSGDIIKGTGCGKQGVVVLNEFTDTTFTIMSHVNNFTFNSEFDKNCTTMIGDIMISDRLGGHFQDFMRDNVAKVLGVSETHIIFSLSIFFIGDSTNDNSNQAPIAVKPLIFHMYHLAHGFGGVEGANVYTMLYLADYNSYGLLPNYTKLYQMTITHKDGNTGTQLPIIDQGSQNLTTRQENKINAPYRTQRLDMNKTMQTLQDVMDGLDFELKSQILPNKAELQTWMANLVDGYTPFILPPKQEKSGGELPLVYNVKIDKEYSNYTINNRNLPWDQPEQSQAASGIKSIPVKPGSTITQVIRNLMKLSRQVGTDVTETPSKLFKINVSTTKTCDEKYQFDINTKRYIIPSTGPGTENTGPGESAVNPLSYTYQENLKDKDIISVEMNLNSDLNLTVLEKPSNSQNTRVILGNREQFTVERIPATDFFKSGFSGIRAMASPNTYGLEFPGDSIKVDNILKTNITQTSSVTLTILGNPDLLSDIFRNPLKVAQDNDDSPNYYKFPEFYPMYVNLNIMLQPISQFGLKPTKDVPSAYYYNGYYHLGAIQTIFQPDGFIQVLQLFRTDDIT